MITPFAGGGGSVRASHPVALGSNPGVDDIFLLVSSRTLDKSNPYCAYAGDFANAVRGKGLH